MENVHQGLQNTGKFFFFENPGQNFLIVFFVQDGGMNFLRVLKITLNLIISIKSLK